MTTITQKKNYIHPLTRVVLLNAEDTILAASGEQADTAGVFCIYAQRDNRSDWSSKENAWGDSPLDNAPW